MRKMVQSEGSSPKRVTASQQLKSASDCIGASGNSVPSHGKGKKREKVEQSDSIKRVHGPKACDGHHDSSRNESTIKCQVAKITEKGGLFNFEGVEVLLNLMQHDGSERKLELAGRILLADVIAATDRFDCLCRFMQLKGLLVLSDWLQEAHKSKTGDMALKENDKSVEELLLALLRALDKLPVDLYALKTSNIGKSVNNLRTHKSAEVQKKARSLVDTWKKRVDEEMTKINDEKPGCGQSVSLSAKASFPEASHETGTCKTSPVKPSHGESSLKSSTAPTGNKKSASAPSSAAIHARDLQCKSEGTSGTTEIHFVMAKEEKSSGSSQSLGNRQSCSGDHTKSMGTYCKEDAPCSIVANANHSKSTGGTSKHQKPSNDVFEADVTESQKESNCGKSRTIDQNKMSDKVSQHGVTCEGKPDFPVADGNSKRLIIKFQRNSSQSGNGDFCKENSSLGSRASSPSSPPIYDKNDHKRKIKEEFCQANVAADINIETRKNVTKKTAIPKEDDKSPSALCGYLGTDDNGKVEHMPKSSFSSSRKEKGPFSTESKPGKPSIHSFNPMIALVESCVKHSEPTASNGSSSVGDDIGMDLLASVATGELSKCDQAPSISSPVRKLPTSDVSSAPDEAKSRFQNILHQGPNNRANNVDLDSKKDRVNASTSLERGKLQFSHAESSKYVPDAGKNTAVSNEHVSLAEHTQSSANPLCENEQNIRGGSALNCSSNSNGDVKESIMLDAASQIREKGNPEGSFPHLDKVVVPAQENTSVDHEVKIKEAVGKTESSNMDLDKEDASIGGLDAVVSTKKDLPLDGANAEDSTGIIKSEKPDADALVFSGSEIANSEPISGLNSVKSNDVTLTNYSETCGVIKKKQSSPNSSVLENNFQSTKVTLSTGDGSRHSQGNKIEEHCHTALNTQEQVPVALNHEDECAKPMDSKLAGSVMGNLAPDKAAKCDFDLNEGVMSDEGSHGESAVTSHSLICSSAVTLPKLAPFSVTPISSSSAAPITVASPAKGPFFPPENPVKSQAALGWKGSAATSAFRPTEPRKVLEVSLSASEVSADGGVVKENHPSLGIDLNVPDEQIVEEIASHSSLPERCSLSETVSIKGRKSGVLDLDLNKADEDAENGQLLLNTSRKLETPQATFSNGPVNGLRQFDLNDGPGLEEIHTEPVSSSQLTRNSMVPLRPPIGDLKMGNTELGSLTPWHPQENSYPPVTITPLLPERGDQNYKVAGPVGAQRFLGSSVGGLSFGGDIYRGPMLSSPAMNISSAATFPYNSGFPFNSSYLLAPASFSTGVMTYPNSSSGGVPCFPDVSSQIMGPTNATSCAHAGPYHVNVLDRNASSSGSDNGRKWGKQSLDLNAGPGISDIEGKDDKLLPSLRQPSITIPQTFPEENSRIYHIPGSGVKRKEPESGWGTERFPYKQLSWQ